MKRFFVLLLAVTLLLSGCACIPGSKLPANTDRYFLYAANDQVYCLDSKTGKTTSIRTSEPVSGISNALIADSGKKIVFEATLKDSEDYALFYWDGKSDSAGLVDKNADMARINKKMDFLIYMKVHDGHYDLYQHDIKKNSVQMIAENVGRVSMTEDGKSILYVQENEGQLGLFRYQRNGNMKRIAELGTGFYGCIVNATADHKVVCYTKRDSEGALGGTYMWTQPGGEKQLPFQATDDMAVMDKNEIYYIVNDGDYSCYYYNGKTSKLLLATASNHLHKLSDELVCYRGRNENSEKYSEDFLVYKGKQNAIGGYMCDWNMLYGGLSLDGKTVYAWENDYLYRNTRGTTGNLSTEQYLNTGDNYRPRGMEFYGDHLAYVDEGRLYLDGQMITSEYDDFSLSMDGEMLVYASGENLYTYSDGSSEFLGPAGSYHLPAVSGKVVMEKNGALYLVDKKGTEEITEKCQSVCVAYPWSVKSMGNIILGGWVTGMWYTQMGTDMIVY